MFTDPGNLPFDGEDIWNAWELSWLEPDGRPSVATAEIRVPANSTNLIESKSLKLYLNSHANERYASSEELAGTISADLAQSAGAKVTVQIFNLESTAGMITKSLPGDCIDVAPYTASENPADAGKLVADRADVREEEIHTHLFRSLCPVTDQPDTGSLLIRYRGPTIDRATLLSYLVSFRNHNAFHEDCVERIFVDVMARCAPDRLTVYARFNRRGGLDINPFRSNFEKVAENLRLWRQ